MITLVWFFDTQLKIALSFEIRFDLKHDIPLYFNNYWEKAYIFIYGCKDISGDSTAYPALFDRPLYLHKNYLQFTQNINLENKFQLKGVTYPSDNDEVANKLYVDDKIKQNQTLIDDNKKMF